MNLGVGVTLIFINDVVLVGVNSRGFPHHPHIGRSGGVHLDGNPPYFGNRGRQRRSGGIKFGTGG